MIQTNKMNNNNDHENNDNNRSNARFGQSMIVSDNFWRANFVRCDEGERREEKTTRVVVQEEKQVVYRQSLKSKGDIKEQARIKHRPSNTNLKLKRLPNNKNNNDEKKNESSMLLFSTLSFWSRRRELSVSDPLPCVNKLQELVTVTNTHTDMRSRDITRHHNNHHRRRRRRHSHYQQHQHHNPYQRHPSNRSSHLNSDRYVLSLYTTWGAILLTLLLLATSSLLSLSSSLSNSINSVNGNGIQAGANPMKATVVSSSSSSLLSSNNNNNQQTNSVLLLAGNTKQADSPQASSREIEKQIVDKILGEGYDKRIRPAGSGPYNASRPGSDGPTIVKVNTLVRSISKIDDVTMEYSVQLSLRQEWTDDRLAFGKMSQYRNYGLNSITLTEQERLWKPDLFFRNEKEGHFHKIIMPNVLLRIKGEGQVLYSIRISLVLACPMDLKYYPLDKQNCTIEMASYGYLDEDLKFLWKENNPVQIAKPLNLPRFTLETYDTAYCTSRTTTGAYSCLRIDLIFKREFSYYLIQIYIPCCMLVIVSWVSFWLDPNAIPARVSLGVTTLLTMATQISGINASLPPVSYTKAIDVWTGVCLTFVFGALLEFALVNYASRSDQHKREMLTSALTHTQQMRWREATAAAAAAGVAPPTSPPPDENSPSMLATKQPTFFGPFLPLTAPHCTGAHLAGMGGINQTTVANGQLAHQQQHSHQLRSTTAAAAAAAAAGEQLDHFKKNPRLAGTSSINGRGIATVDGGTTAAAAAANNATNYSTIGGTARVHVNGNIANKKLPPGSQLNNNNVGPTNGNNNINRGNLLNNNLTNSNNVNNHPSKMTPQINCPLQYMKSPREIHLMSPKPPKRKNWCKMWLAKFPTRSKRIDVISRIFFPLKFALFNLVYWTTYLFREEDTVA